MPGIPLKVRNVFGFQRQRSMPETVFTLPPGGPLIERSRLASEPKRGKCEQPNGHADCERRVALQLLRSVQPIVENSP